MVENTAIFAGKTSTEIDLKDRVIRKTSKLMGFVRTSTYELGEHVAVHIKDESTIVEGYHITSFGVYLTIRGRKIRISSADDQSEAHFIQSQITELLKKSAVKCHANMNTPAPEPK